MKKKWKIVIGVLVAAAAAAGIAGRVFQRVEVRTKTVAPENIARSFTEEGFVKAEVELTVYPMFRSRILSLAVEDAGRVEEGDLLAVLDDRETRYAMAELEARLKKVEGEELKLTEEPGEAAMEELALAIEQTGIEDRAAERDYLRTKKLYEEDAISRETYEAARDRLEIARYELARRKKAREALRESYDPPPGSRDIVAGRREAFRAQMDLRRYQAGEHRIYAPVSGFIGRLVPEEKEIVDSRTPLMTIFHSAKLYVEADVLTRDVFKLAPGMAVRLIVDIEDREEEFEGEITRIAGHAEEDISPLGLEERRVRVRISPAFPEDLPIGPGYDLDVVFTTEEAEDQLVVPLSALFTYDGEDALFVVEGGRARLRRVTLGLETKREAAIEEGLSEGELVILDPRAEGLRKGARVRAR